MIQTMQTAGNIPDEFHEELAKYFNYPSDDTFVMWYFNSSTPDFPEEKWMHELDEWLVSEGANDTMGAILIEVPC